MIFLGNLTSDHWKNQFFGYSFLEILRYVQISPPKFNVYIAKGLKLHPNLF